MYVFSIVVCMDEKIIEKCFVYDVDFACCTSFSMRCFDGFYVAGPAEEVHQ